MNDYIKFDTNDSMRYNATPIIPTKVFDLVNETDPILREVLPEFDFANPPVDPKEFASALVETCKKNNGYGLSASQCGFRYRVFVMGAGDEYVAFYNPVLVRFEGEAHIKEGCLSFPMLGLSITRPASIWIEYQDFEGNKKEAHYVGMSARCWLHELDHMNGILYTSRVKPLALQQGVKKRMKIAKLITRAQKSSKKLETVLNV